jgi:hypothetical protein
LVTPFCSHSRSILIVLCTAVSLPARLVSGASFAANLQADYEWLTGHVVGETSGWQPARATTGSLLFVAPDQYSELPGKIAALPPANAPVNEARQKKADALYDLAMRAADAGQLSLAYQWVTETVRENPDHANARRVLGYENHDGQWLTAFAARQVDGGKVWDARFGWIAKEDVPRYEQGERLVGKQWVTAEVDAARRTRMEDGWQVRTDHFLVTSNLSLEAAAELAARLERLHQVWQQLFAGFWTSDAEVKQLFSGERLARERHQPFHVYLHRDREDYINTLKHQQPRVVETQGIYFDTEHQAHFFAGPDQDAGTVYHETVHELFQESHTGAKRAAEKANFWVVEGIATYFETLSEHRDARAGLYYTIGQSSAGRLPAARARVLRGHDYIPLAQLTRWGRNELQRQSDLARIYSEASGVSAFLMDGEQARYREPLVRYLQAIYAGHDDAETLARSTSRTYAELDAEYQQYMASLP